MILCVWTNCFREFHSLSVIFLVQVKIWQLAFFPMRIKTFHKEEITITSRWRKKYNLLSFFEPMPILFCNLKTTREAVVFYPPMQKKVEIV